MGSLMEAAVAYSITLPDLKAPKTLRLKTDAPQQTLRHHLGREVKHSFVGRERQRSH